MTTPADYTGIKAWLPTSYPQYMWSGAVNSSSHPAVDGDTVQNVQSQVGGLTYTTTLSRSPIFRIDGTRNGALHFLNSSGIKYLQINNNIANSFHTTGLGSILFWIKFDTATTGTLQLIFDSCAITTANTGIALLRTTNQQMQFFVVKSSAGTPVIAMTTTDTIADTNWHSVKIKSAPGSNNTSIQIDNNTPNLGTLGALGTGNSTNTFTFGQISTLGDLYTPSARISDFVILDQVITSTDENHWNSWNAPLGGPATSTLDKQWFWYQRNWKSWYTNKYLFRPFLFPGNPRR